MERAILDTDTLSEILKGRNARVVQRASAYARSHERFTFTAVSVYEILYGLHHRGAEHQLAQAESSFAENEVIVPVLADYKVAGLVRGTARAQGVQLALEDYLIGSVAHRLGLPVITGNIAHFQAMRSAGLDLRIEDWRQA